MKTKATQKTVSTVVMLALFISVFAVSASANNHLDSAFKFYFNGNTWETNFREKTDTSNCYMYCKQSTNSSYYFTAHAQGSFYEGKPTQKWDASHGYTTVMRLGTETAHIRNWVKDYYPNTLVFASIAGVPSSSVAFTATGVWSPDNYVGIEG